MEAVCITTLSSLSEKDVRFLVAMSEDTGTSTISDIALRMGVRDDYVQVYKRRLIARGIIAVPSRGRVMCIVPLLMEYVRTII